MFQTDQSTAVSSLPTPAATATPGFFTGGNPGSGQAATILDADFLNMMMMELINLVEAAGLTPSKTTYNQVLAAIKVLGSTGQLGAQPHGECRLSMTSATAVTLKPFNGNNLIINGVPEQIPSAGITLSNSGLTASTVYYVYAAMVSGAMTLVTSTTGHNTASNGVETMTGDTTKTLVGMVMPNTSGQFQMSGIWLGMLNWFQRQDVECHVPEPGSPLTTSSTSLTVQLSAAYTITFLTWGVTDMRSSGYVTNSSIATSTFLIGIDSVTTGSAVNTFANSSAGFDGSIGVTAKFTLTEGAHFAACCGKVTAGTASYVPDIEVIVQG